MTNEKIFICYSSKDSNFTTKLRNDLIKDGLDVWLDQTNLSIGGFWDNEVGKALKTSTTVIVVLSPESVDSENVKDEVRYAREKEKKIIPILLRNCDIPYWINRFHRIEFIDEYTIAYQRLLNALRGKSSSIEKHSETGETVTVQTVSYDSTLGRAYTRAINEYKSRIFKIGEEWAGGIIISVDDTGRRGFIVERNDIKEKLNWDDAKEKSEHSGLGLSKLPTKDQLNFIYKNRKIFEPFSAEYYWSSTEVNKNEAYAQNLHSGNKKVMSKSTLNCIRLVRAFDETQ